MRQVLRLTPANARALHNNLGDPHGESAHHQATISGAFKLPVSLRGRPVHHHAAGVSVRPRDDDGGVVIRVEYALPRRFVCQVLRLTADEARALREKLDAELSWLEVL